MKTWQRLKKQPELWKRYFLREQVIRDIREFFHTRGFHEVETPLLLKNPPAESYVDVFRTTLYDRHRNPTDAYLATSPETSLKKLLAAGIGNCFALTKSFRNMETQSRLHNPEFTILEWYRTGVAYEKIMSDCEDLLKALSGVSGQKLRYQGNIIDVSPPWDRMTITEAFSRFAGINSHDLYDVKRLAGAARKKGYRTDGATWEQIYNQIFLNEIEPKLGLRKPVILYEYPAAVAALARIRKDNPLVAERFEFYIGGLEMGDAYTELIDWREQESRFKREMKEIERLGKTVYDYDQDFIQALKSGLPDCSGIAVGVDRIVMLLADVNDIAETLFFPGKDLFGAE
ncbi:EF-P lysine aminoacylase GenX [Candidatus Gottesmanbacteria bacterium RBG_16_52_11]|uniref:EF-P lysine aminoacylase GenX n=1 Tax=Candidatus Gottesmanbacteria bacterium RBG_16_52_11 TaxID=1798374 RepID=A0A1F5YVI2_9BACT|nr:MAG: EF-P lysine aminoacylase GenX [Candidatus Gottesmanbacteria bacterium RBG_16_52_11]